MGIINYLDNLDRQLLVWLNGFNSPAFDEFMIFVTGKLVWIPFYALIIGFIYINYKKTWWLILIAIGCTITAADQFASTLLKPLTGRLRPCHVDELQGFLNMPDGCGGKFGFISSHSSNTFGLAAFLFLLFRKKYPWISLMFVWAAVVSYSRIYLAVHYPGDILAGALAGCFWAYLFYYIYMKTSIRVNAILK